MLSKNRLIDKLVKLEKKKIIPERKRQQKINNLLSEKVWQTERREGFDVDGFHVAVLTQFRKLF